MIRLATDATLVADDHRRGRTDVWQAGAAYDLRAVLSIGFLII
jgi:hypothetical protein